MTKKTTKNIAELVKQSSYAVIVTGAGISTESGLPDFRSQGGLWDGKRPEEISHASKVGTDEFREFFTKRLNDVAEHEPNAAHHLLAEWEEKGLVKSLLTQNIDGYHKAAGSKKVLELHGHLRYLTCDECERDYDASKFTVEHSDACVDCEGTVRPNVTLFGEELPHLAWSEAIQEARKADLVIVLGTSLQVWPFNSLIDEAYQGGNAARVVIVTESETPYDVIASIRLHDKITATLQAVNEYLV